MEQAWRAVPQPDGQVVHGKRVRVLELDGSLATDAEQILESMRRDVPGAYLALVVPVPRANEEAPAELVEYVAALDRHATESGIPNNVEYVAERLGLRPYDIGDKKKAQRLIRVARERFVDRVPYAR